jgi:hypothetical protein
MIRRVLLASLVFGILLGILVGCMNLGTLTVDPTLAMVEVGETVAFTATDHLGNPVSVTWTVTSGPGTITAAGVYTSPASVTGVTTATVTAARTDRPAVTASATVAIEPPIDVAIVDASGDAFGPATYDVTRVSTSRTADTLTITVDFTTVPSIPTAGNPVGVGDLAGFICFDKDESKATGIPSASYYFAPTLPVAPAIGVDYFVSLFYVNVSGNYDIYETTGFTDVGDAAPAIAGTVLTLTIPLTELGGDDGKTDMNTVFGDDVAPTDCAPDEVTAVVTSKPFTPKVVIHDEGFPYADFLNGLGITGAGWIQTRSFTPLPR